MERSAWRLIVSGENPPSFNMGLDYALWESARKGEAPVTLRFYRWKPASVSLGYRQAPEKLLNLSFCRQQRVPIVQRPTGGSALFHDLELTYSFTARAEAHPLFTSPVTSYLGICQALGQGLKRLGINLQVRGFSSGTEPTFSNQACFNLATRHDLLVDGRKIVGSAQRRDRTSFLQHGSILLSLRKSLWEQIFLQPVDFSRIVSLSELLEVLPQEKQLILHLKEGFQEFFHCQFLQGSPTAAEDQQARHYALSRFPPL
ncbi:MAG TPA: biotin/lipoate A/B protein ligase family protein [bacterium]|nr:biotin/lipoate A/B protein ligase family protein [bacterium]